MPSRETLYKVDSKGKVRVWWMEYDYEKYRTCSGIRHGKIVNSGWTYPEAKNVGRSNETTVEEQVLAEVNAEYTKKQHQGKYHPTITGAGKGAKFHECMLASTYDPKKHKKFPYYSQPKYDGIRCLASKDGLFSRNGKPIVAAPHIQDELEYFFRKWPEVVLDGELYNHDLKDQFEKIVSLVRKTKPTDEDLEESQELVQYHVYDAIMDGSYEHRDAFLFSEIQPSEIIHVAPTLLAKDENALLDNLGIFLEKGYEGQMLRVPGSPYEGKRSKFLIKHKEFEDKEFIITDIIEGIGNWSGRAKAVEIRLEDGTSQNAGVRGSFDFLEDVLYNAKSYIGTEVTVRYQNRTEDGKLRFPVVTMFWKGKRDV